MSNHWKWKKLKRQKLEPGNTVLFCLDPAANSNNSYKQLSCCWQTRTTHCITTNGKILKQSRDHKHALSLVICHPVATIIDIAYLCTKFDDFRFSRSSDMIGAHKILMDQMTWPRLYQGWFVVRRLRLAHLTSRAYIKLGVFAITNYKDAYCIRQRKMQKLRWFKVVRVTQSQRQRNHLIECIQFELPTRI